MRASALAMAFACAAGLLSFVFLIDRAHSQTAAEVNTEIDKLKGQVDTYTGDKKAVLAKARALRKAMQDKLITLDALLGDTKVVQGEFSELMAALTKLITDQAARAYIADGLEKDAAMKKVRDDFSTAYFALAEDHKIHVIDSWTGDLNSAPGSSRRCPSLNAVRALCQEKDKCQLPGKKSETTAFIDPIPLCGFDPVPLAEDRYKGVNVRFVCLRGNKEYWDKIAENPGTDPDAKPPAPWGPGKINSVTLQSNIMEVRCPYPTPPAAQTSGSATTTNQ